MYISVGFGDGARSRLHCSVVLFGGCVVQITVKHGLSMGCAVPYTETCGEGNELRGLVPVCARQKGMGWRSTRDEEL